MEAGAKAEPLGPAAAAVVAWGVGGVCLLLAQAIWRLTPYALEPLGGGLGAVEAAVYVAWVAVSAYAEGYRAFQKRWSPRVVARALHLARHPRPLYVALAPAYCMALFCATRRALAAAWGITAMVVAFIVLLRHTPQPWRGIVDGGVVVALVWGLAAIVVSLGRAAAGAPLGVSSEIPGA